MGNRVAVSSLCGATVRRRNAGKRNTGETCVREWIDCRHGRTRLAGTRHTVTPLAEDAMKGLDHQHHSEKKKPRHTLMEKRAEKRAKKLARTLEGHGRVEMPATEGTHA